MAMELKDLQAAHEETQRKLAESEAAREKELTEAAEREKALTERIALIERDARVKRLTDIVQGNGNPNACWIGQHDEQVTFLMSLAETFGEDSPQFTHYVSEQNANAARIRESGLFREIGSSGSGVPPTVVGEVERKLTEMMASSGKPRHEALVDLIQQDPALYARYDREQKAAAQRGGGE